MTFHEMENGFAPYLRLPIRILYLYSTRCGGQGRSGTPRRTLVEFQRGFSSRVFLFFPSFFSKSGARSPPGMIPRDVKVFVILLMQPEHTSRLLILRCESRRPIRFTAVLSSPDFAVTVAVHLSIIRTPVIVVTMLTPIRYQLQRWSLPSINA